MILFIALTSLAAYLTIGLRLFAPRFVTRYVESNIRNYPRLAADDDEVQRWRREASYLAVLLAFVWPAYTAFMLMAKAVERSSPLTSHEDKQKLKAQAEYIARLERETGIR